MIMKKKVFVLATALGLIWTLSFSNSILAQEDSVRHLDEVQVRGVRVDNSTPLTSSKIGRDEIADCRTEASLPYVIELQPSVVSSGENGKVGNTSFRVRGVDGARINVGINGITLNDPESQTVYWVNIPNLSGMAQQMSLQRGVGASTGGTASFGGALNIQTLNAASEPYAVADMSVGSWNTRQYGIGTGTGVGKKGFSLDVAYNGLTSDGYVRGGFCDHQSLFLTGGHYGERSLLKAVVIIGQQHTGITWDGASAEDLDSDPTFNPSGAYTDEWGVTRYYDNESDNYNQNHYQLYYTRLLGERWSVEATADYTRGYGYYEEYKEDWWLTANGDAVTRKHEDNHSLAGILTANYSGQRLSLSFGQTALYFVGDHYGDQVGPGAVYEGIVNNEYRILNNEWGDSHYSLFPIHYSQKSNSQLFEWYRNEGRKQDGTTFVKMNYDFSARLNLYGDLQYRNVHYAIGGVDDDLLGLDFDECYHFFNPKVGVNWLTKRNNRLYAVAGVSQREPARADVKENVKVVGDTVKAEAMLDIELGYQYKSERCAASVNGYAMLYRDQLTPKGQLNSGGYALMENVDKSYRLGVELTGGFRVTRWMKLDANLTLSSNKVVDYRYDDFESGKDTVAVSRTATTDLSFSPSVVGAGVATFEFLKHGKVQLIGKYVGAMYCDNTSREAVRQDAYFVANLKVGYTWHLHNGGEVEAQLVVNNLFDRAYRLSAWTADYAYEGVLYTERAFYQQPGINFMGCLKMKL